MSNEYYEVLIRHAAITADGKHCELLERITYERTVQPGGAPSESVERNRRFDLRTGEPVVHIGGDDYELRDLGSRLTVVRPA